ncbi:hypothetical protein BXO88_02250 [Oribacterium sp. C9]|uniref:hypothetical protein n=1 Tax=Oribacterium sp. C9 TaxID=1943579 RepID=UPI00098F4897|nr:hypothetical protein [Oribacterium sp. C9]OON88016.1 hypothetical protein BXO88_02250 [Oribacterium sp. C9]
MKLEVEMTEEQLNLLILSAEVYGRILMNQPDLVVDIIAEDRFFYDKEDPDNDRKFHEWIKARDELTEKLRAALNTMFRDSYKSDTCQNLIDIWHVLRHLQYNISDNIDKNLYDVRASEPYQGGTEPLMKVRVIEKPEL